jgi:sodium-dependent dicarboxylate transporter 2/3/5
MPAAATAAITTLCAVWWIFEPIPIPFTSLLPLALFPLFGILTPEQAAHAYGSPLILLLLGGFMISAAMADSGAHRRLALFMVNLFGGASARSLVLGFMSASALLSMWISNTATTLMLLPVALAVLERSERQLAIPLLLGIAYAASIGGIGTPVGTPPNLILAIPLLLGIAYAASIGGIGTPVGTPPNLIFMQVYADQFGTTPTFPEWMAWALPVVIIFVPLAGLWLTRGIHLHEPVRLPRVGKWQPAEKRVLTLFMITALLWITRKAPFGGWSEWLGLPSANDASVALLAVIAMAMTPAGNGERLLRWESARQIPWGVLILFGGGIAIASAFMESGLAERLAAQLGLLAAMPVWLMILCICLSVTFLTEVTSNTATASLLMPLLAATSVAIDIDPALLMVPAALSASCAFMLPVATAPKMPLFTAAAN